MVIQSNVLSILSRIIFMNFRDFTVEEALLFSFFSIYLYELEKNKELLNTLKAVVFHSDEANTDKDLKLAVKNYMKNHPRISPKNNDSVFLRIDDKEVISNLEKLFYFSINNVFLPEELTNEHKKAIRQSKTSIYTNPDLYIEVLGSNNILQYISLELKSTKQDKIPGSSAQQANPYEWTLFVKHSVNNGMELMSGLYANTVTGKLPFPDRSPRPQVSFSQLKNWNDAYRKHDKTGFRLTINTKDLDEKALVISDWERALVKDWMEYIKSDKKPNKWFDHTQRIFVTELILYYESLNSEDKKAFFNKNIKYVKE